MTSSVTSNFKAVIYFFLYVLISTRIEKLHVIIHRLLLKLSCGINEVVVERE